MDNEGIAAAVALIGLFAVSALLNFIVSSIINSVERRKARKSKKSC